MRLLAILGSARVGGNTSKLLQATLEGLPAEVIDLAEHSVEHYDYGTDKPADDFVAIVERLLASDLVVFATPVYWYSMSGRMKVFFDRLSDLVTVRKDYGRALRGKRVVLVSSSSESEPPDGFASPFRDTCDYLDMSFLGSFHGMAGDMGPAEEVLAAAREFGRRVLAPQLPAD